MSVKVFQLLLFFCLTIILSHCITLRVRQVDGSMMRLKLESNGTLVDLYQELIRTANLSMGLRSDLNFIGFGSNCSFESLQHNNTLLSDVSLSSGEIITLESTVRRSIRLEDTVSDVSAKTGSGLKRGRLMPSGAKRASSRGAMTLSDIERQRQSLVRLRRQKAVNTTIVRFGTSPQMTCSRLYSIGGVALLLGRVVAIGDAGPGVTQQDIEVVRAIEICRGNDTFSSCYIDDSESSILKQSIAISKMLNLTVVGCCIVMPVSAQSSWNAACVYIGLQVQAVARSIRKLDSMRTEEFVVISVLANPDTAVKKKRARILGSRLNFQQNVTSDVPFAAEAFSFSNETYLLLERGILSVQPKLENSKGGALMGVRELIALTGPVIVRNSEETQLIESCLLCVPLPITSWNMAFSPGGDHLFPSLPEMMDLKTSQVAKQYLMKLLRNVLKQKHSAIELLKDAHILLYLRHVSDEGTFNRLCDYLRTVPSEASTGKVPRMPAELLITIEMIESSLRLALEDDMDFSNDR